MKTFEQFHETNSLGVNCIAISEQEFKQIQLDAMKEGAIRAALMAPQVKKNSSAIMATQKNNALE